MLPPDEAAVFKKALFRAVGCLFRRLHEGAFGLASANLCSAGHEFAGRGLSDDFSTALHDGLIGLAIQHDKGAYRGKDDSATGQCPDDSLSRPWFDQ